MSGHVVPFVRRPKLPAPRTQPPGDGPSPLERELLELYRDLGPDAQAIMRQAMLAIIGRQRGAQ